MVLVGPSIRDTQDGARRLQEAHPSLRVLAVAQTVVERTQRILNQFHQNATRLGLKHKGGSFPSTGLIAVVLFLQMCNKVTTYGFGQLVDQRLSLRLIGAWPHSGAAPPRAGLQACSLNSLFNSLF